MAAVGTYLSYLGYINTIEENGVVKARLNFQANDSYGNLSVGRIGNVDFSDDMPSFISPGSNIKYEVESLGYESVTATGVLKIYPLTANTSYTMQGYDSSMTPSAEVSFTATITNNNPKAKDLASGTLAESISASTTTLLVYVGEGGASTIKAVWPDTPFYASIMPASPSAGVPNNLDSEIVKVTNVSNDQVGNTALTVTRAQRGTTGKAFTAGAIVTNADYAEDAVLLGDEGTAENPTPWVGTNDIENGSITPEKMNTNDLGIYFAPGIQNSTIGSSATQVASFTIPRAGMYLFIANAGFSGGDENTFLDVSVKLNNTIIGQTFTTTYTGTPRPFAVVMCQAQCSAGDVVKLYAAISGGANTLTRPNGLAIFRIG